MEILKVIVVGVLAIIISLALIALLMWAACVFGAAVYASFGLGGLVMCAAVVAGVLSVKIG